MNSHHYGLGKLVRFKPQRGSHKLKYRYFYHPTCNQLIRFDLVTLQGYWFAKDGTGKFLTEPSDIEFKEYCPPRWNAFEVTLSQGLHYMKGNYVE
jgi:hypothetical protein